MGNAPKSVCDGNRKGGDGRGGDCRRFGAPRDSAAARRGIERALRARADQLAQDPGYTEGHARLDKATANQRRSRKRNPSEGRRPIAPGSMLPRRRSANSTTGASRKRPICVASRRNSTPSGRPRSKAMSMRARRPPQPWLLPEKPTAKPVGPIDPLAGLPRLGLCRFLGGGFRFAGRLVIPLILGRRTRAQRRH